MTHPAAVTACNLDLENLITETILPNVLVLLSHCMMASDNEVRDRATYFKAILEQHKASLNNQFIFN